MDIPEKMTVHCGLKIIDHLVGRNYPAMARAIQYSFRWFYTPQGCDYWREIATDCRMLRRDGGDFSLEEEMNIMGAIMLTMDRTT